MENELQFMTTPTLKVNSFKNGHFAQLLKCDQEVQSLDETSGLRAPKPAIELVAAATNQIVPDHDAVL